MCPSGWVDNWIRLHCHHKWERMLVLCGEARRQAGAEPSEGQPGLCLSWNRGTRDASCLGDMAWAIQARQVKLREGSQFISKRLRIILFRYRDQYVRINWENIRSGTENNFEAKNPSDVLLHGGYDYGSVMHYSRCAFTSTGLETITPLERWQCPLILQEKITKSFRFRTHMSLSVREMGWARQTSTSWWAFMVVNQFMIHCHSWIALQSVCKMLSSMSVCLWA